MVCSLSTNFPFFTLISDPIDSTDPHYWTTSLRSGVLFIILHIFMNFFWKNIWLLLCDSDWFSLPKLKTILLSPLPDKRVGLASGYISIPIFYNSHSDFCRASIMTFLWVN